MIKTLRQLIRLQRVLQQFHLKTSKSAGWLLSGQGPCERLGRDLYSNSYPVTGFMIERFKKRFWSALEKCMPYESPIARDDMPEWLRIDESCMIDEVENLVNFVFRLHPKSSVAAPCSLVATLDDLLEEAQAQIDDLIEHCLEQLMENEQEESDGE